MAAGAQSSAKAANGGVCSALCVSCAFLFLFLYISVSLCSLCVSVRLCVSVADRICKAVPSFLAGFFFFGEPFFLSLEEPFFWLLPAFPISPVSLCLSDLFSRAPSPVCPPPKIFHLASSTDVLEILTSQQPLDHLSNNAISERCS